MTVQRGTQEIFEHIDLADRVFKRLAGFASRIAAVLERPGVQSNPHLLGALDDFLGAIYALIFAKQRDFIDRTGQSIQPDKVLKRAKQLRNGKVRTEGKWIAGFHFNSALFRLAAVNHRVLKIVIGQPSTGKNVPTLRTAADKLYLACTKQKWSRQNIDKVHAEVTDLKHTPKGKFYRRNVKYVVAVNSVGEVLDLIEAWLPKK